VVGNRIQYDGTDWLQNGWTPLHFAAKAGHLDVVKLLVESGACPKHETIDNKMPISLAASAGHTDVLSYLLRQDRNTHLLLDDTKVPLEYVSHCRLNLMLVRIISTQCV